MPPTVGHLSIDTSPKLVQGSTKSARKSIASSRRLSSLTDKLGGDDILGEAGAWFPHYYQAKESKDRESTLTQPPAKRTSHCAVFWDNKLWTFGGITTDYCEFTVHHFDPATGLWKMMASDGKPPLPRCGFTATLYNNSVFVFGGTRDSTYFGDLIEYRLDADMWQQVACRTRTIPRKRHGHAMAVDADVGYVFGGCLKSGYLNDFWAFDFTGRIWREIVADVGGDNVPEARAHHSVTCFGGKVFVFGGYNGVRCLSDLWIYCDVGEVFGFGDWRQIVTSAESPQPGPRMNHGSCVLCDGRVYIFGGSNWRYTNELWTFDANRVTLSYTSSNEAACQSLWELLPSKGVVPCPRALCAVTAEVDKGTIFVFGGMNDRSKLNDMHSICFDSVYAIRTATRKARGASINSRGSSVPVTSRRPRSSRAGSRVPETLEGLTDSLTGEGAVR